MSAPARGSGRPGISTHSVVANLLLAAAALAAFLAAAEGVCRLVDLRPRMGSAMANPPWMQNRWLLARDDYRKAFADEGFLGRYYEVYEWDRWLFYRLRPNRELSFLDPFAPREGRESTRWTVHTSAQGYRTKPFEPKPAPGRRRVVALGDSSTFCWGVEGTEAYPARLEESLDQREGGGARWEVLNLGVPGYSTFQGRVMLERQALGLAPDVVTWSYLANDGAMTGEADRATYAQRQGWLGAALEFAHHSRAYETLEAWIARLRRADGEHPATNVRNVASYAEASANIGDAIQIARQAGVPLVLVANCVRGPVAEVVARVARETGTPYLDATALVDAAVPQIAQDPAFAADRERLAQRYGAEALAANPALYGFLPDRCHPNRIGHRVIADALGEIVARAAGPESAR
ncbi:MAG TPA: GDSL-type esterase/lipase family protein [Myxococcota bacterium]|nr:GDSL-type esterase/lipase family protein [Myxococcota bacterium]